MGPDDNITREQAIVVLARMACLPAASSFSALARFPDRNEVGAWAADAVFDGAATELSEKDRSIAKHSIMDLANKVLFTDKSDAPKITFDLPAYLYVGDSTTVKITLTDADSVTWELTRDGKPYDMPESFTKDGGMFYFMKAGHYTLKGTAKNSGGTSFCEKTVEVLPVGDIAFSLPEYGYTDRAEEVKLLARNDLDGSVVWTLTKGGTAFPC